MVHERNETQTKRMTVESKRRDLRYIPEVEWHLVTKYEGRKLRMTQSIPA